MLISSLAAIAMGQSLTDSVRLMRWPDVHGDKTVFVYASDLWIADLKGGPARRLTSHPGSEILPKFSPDGKTIAFTAQYDGSNDVFTIPVEGGVPTRLTFEPTSEAVEGWTPDGKKVVFSSNYGNHTNRMARLWLVPATGGLPERTDLAEVADVSFSPDGSKIAYNRSQSHQFNWRRYRGGTQGRISFWDFTTKTYSEIPADREQNYFPMWVGEDVYYISDKNQNTLNLYKYNTGNKKITQLTKFDDADMRWPSTDGKTIVFERNLRLHAYDIATGKITMLDPRVTGDNLSMRPRYVSLGNQVTNFSLSPTGKRLAVEARGDIYSAPATSGETRNLTDSDGVKEESPEWSPDGQFIYYLTDRSGETQIARRPQMGGAEEVIKTPANIKVASFSLSPNGKALLFNGLDFSLYHLDLETNQSKLVVKDGAQMPSADWSQDGKWLTYSKSLPNLLTEVCLYDVTAGKEHQVTHGMFGDGQPTFDMNGKYLYFVSARDYSPGQGILGPHLEQDGAIQRVYMLPLSKDAKNPLLPPDDEEPVKDGSDGAPAPTPAQAGDMKVDLDNMEARLIPLPYSVDQYLGTVGMKNGVMVLAASGITMFNVGSRSIAPIMPLIQGLSFNADRTKLAYKVGSTIGIADIRPGIKIGEGAVALNRVGRIIDPAKEYQQMFWDAWRYERDNYYDEKMLGLNWKAIGDKYSSLLPDIGDRSDFDYILGQLIGELGTGHAYITAGPGGSDPMGLSAGLLGADYEAVGNRVRISKVYRGVNYVPDSRGPLGELGVDIKDGDYLLAIDGESVTAKEGVTQHLIGKVGRKVELTVNSSTSMDGARKYSVYPTFNESNLRYETWVEERRQMVDEMSGGKIGYMHVPDTNVQGMIMFIRGYMSQMDKEAWIIDERYNGGGWIPTFFIDYLTAQFTNVIAPRYGNDTGLRPSLNGPKAMLINQHAGSGGDLFPYLFKKAKIGPLIGKRTWGGLVGIQGAHPLIGGGGLTAPAFGIYDPDTGKWIAENTGIDPDIDVDDRPDLAAKGQDPQLVKAIDYLKTQMKGKKPLQAPPRPKVGGF
jgi:tricorn protease